MGQRRNSGVLLPAFVLTILGCAGVLVLYAVGVPSVPVPGLSPRDNSPARSTESIGVTDRGSPSPSASPRPSSASPTPTRTPGPGRTTRPPSPPRTAGPLPPPPPPAPRCKAGSATLIAVADAWVDQAAPSKNYGGSGNLVVASRDKGRNKRSLVRFATPTVPAGCTVRTARLSLAAKEPNGRRLLVSRASRAWDERVTWATAPAATGAASAATVSATTVTWTVTTQVQAMLGGANYGFVLADAAENSTRHVEQANFDARTGPRPPVLVVSWA